MNIKYDNSMYTTIPPKTVIDLTAPEKVLEEKIADKEMEDQIYYNFLDLEEARNRELISNGKSKRIITG